MTDIFHTTDNPATAITIATRILLLILIYYTIATAIATNFFSILLLIMIYYTTATTASEKDYCESGLSIQLILVLLLTKLLLLLKKTIVSQVFLYY